MEEYFTSNLLYLNSLFTLTVGTVLVLIYESFIKRAWSRGSFTVLVLFTATVFHIFLYSMDIYPLTGTAFYGQIFVDKFSGLVTALILTISTLVAILSLGQLEKERVKSSGEYYALFLMSVIGAIIFNTASEFITLFIGLEIMSMALYCLCGSAIGVRSSSESAMKYFLLGSFSSAFLLYGIAILFGLSGTTDFIGISESIRGTDSTLLSISIGLITVGLLFKIAAAPFHFWAPDVYQGAPTSVTIFMASVIKASAIVATLRILWIVFPDSIHIWSNAIWALAAITMTIGNLTALRQRSVKRMLAYSSIAHAGYMMVAILVAPQEWGGSAAVIYYLAAYSAMTLGSLAIVMAVASPYLSTHHSDDISRFNSLSKRKPLIAAMMALFMLSLAGIPPGMAGLLAKFFVFSSAVKAGFVGLAVIGMLNSAVSAYYYLRVIVAMYFMEPKSGESYSEPHTTVPWYAAVGVCALVVILLGVFPSRFYENAKNVVEPALAPRNLP
jgi:NADH-quinone oxidoreductase subunit N